jgi:hypothetical protein
MKCRMCGIDAVGFKELEPLIKSFNNLDRPNLFEALCEEHLKEAEKRESHGRYYWLSDETIKRIEQEEEKKQYKKLKKKFEDR